MLRAHRILLTAVLLFSGSLTLGQDENDAQPTNRETWLTKSRLIGTSIGVTRDGTTIPCWIDKAELGVAPERLHVWLVGGLDSSDIGIDATVRLMEWFHTQDDATNLRQKLALSAVVVGNPDGTTKRLGEANNSGGQPTRGYPPKGDAYVSAADPEAAYLWRWLGTQAPDLVIEVRADSDKETAKARAGWWMAQDVPTELQLLLKHVEAVSKSIGFTGRRRDGAPFVQRLFKRGFAEQDSLVAALGREAAAGMGTIPALRLCVTADSVDAKFHSYLLSLIPQRSNTGVSLQPPLSAARRERSRRIARSPIQVATQLSRRYGHSLKTVQYIPAVAVIGRWRLSELTGDASHREGIDQILAPFREGRQRAIGDQPSGSDFAGHLLFGELALKTGDQKLIALAKAAADFAFDNNGQPREAMPAHVEMSDAVFMACPLLTQVGRLSGEVKYHEMSIRHLAFMRKLCARPDGLYRNSPLNDAAWGRGNGFPALGLAWALDNLPQDHPGRADMLAAFQQHLTALAAHQDPTGMWHQVIDHSGSYRELTATCMITYAMIRGIQQGWLDRAKFEPLIRKAWPAIKARIADDGSLIDVCEGTGKQTSLRAYLDRKAILGPDERGGAMSLLVATEMASFQNKNKP